MSLVHFHSQPLPAHKGYTTSEATTTDTSSPLSSLPEAAKSSSVSALDSSPLRATHGRRQFRHSEARPLGSFDLVKASIESLGPRSTSIAHERPLTSSKQAGTDLEQFLSRESQIVRDSFEPDSHPHSSSELDTILPNMNVRRPAGSAGSVNAGAETPANRSLKFPWHRASTQRGGKLPSEHQDAELAAYDLPDNAVEDATDHSHEIVKKSGPKSKGAKEGNTRSKGRAKKAPAQPRAGARITRATARSVNDRRTAIPENDTTISKKDGTGRTGTSVRSRMQPVQQTEAQDEGGHQKSSSTRSEQAASRGPTADLCGINDLPADQTLPLPESYDEFERNVINVPDDADVVVASYTHHDQASQTPASIQMLHIRRSKSIHSIQQDSMQDILESMLPASRHHSPLKSTSTLHAPPPANTSDSSGRANSESCLADISAEHDIVRESLGPANADISSPVRKVIPVMSICAPRTMADIKPNAHIVGRRYKDVATQHTTLEPDASSEVIAIVSEPIPEAVPIMSICAPRTMADIKPEYHTVNPRFRDIATQHTTLEQETAPQESFQVLPPRMVASTRPMTIKQVLPQAPSPPKPILALRTPVTISATKPSVTTFEIDQPLHGHGLTPLERFANNRYIEKNTLIQTLQVPKDTQGSFRPCPTNAKRIPVRPYSHVETQKRLQPHEPASDRLRKRLRLTLQDSDSSSVSSEGTDEDLDGTTLIESDWAAGLPPHQQRFNFALNEVTTSLLEKLVDMEGALEEKVAMYHEQGMHILGDMQASRIDASKTHEAAFKRVRLSAAAALNTALLGVQIDKEHTIDGRSCVSLAPGHGARRAVRDLISKFA